MPRDNSTARQPLLRGEVVARYRATTPLRGEVVARCRATTPPITPFARAAGWSGRPGCQRGWAARTGQQRRTVCGNIPCPRVKRGPFARAAGCSGRPGCRRGWAATMSALMQHISDRQKNRAGAVSPRSNRTAAPCNTQPRRKQLSRGTARQPRPLGEVVARCRATTSPLRRGCRAVPTSPLRGVVARYRATTSLLMVKERKSQVVARPRDNLATTSAIGCRASNMARPLDRRGPARTHTCRGHAAGECHWRGSRCATRQSEANSQEGERGNQLGTWAVHSA